MSKNDGWGYCAYCGDKMAFAATACPHCGAPNTKQTSKIDASPKSYGITVALCGVFGVVGLHHFYLGNVLHGIFDLALFVFALYFYFGGVSSGDVGLIWLGILLIAIDGLHTLFVFIQLIVGKAKDGAGRVVSLPTT